MDKETKEIISIILLIFFPIVLFFASFLIGRYPISPIDVVNTILCPIFPQLEVNSTITTIVFEIRLPRILGAVVVGACLAISGAAFQSIFKNPLVSSDLLGVSNGAGFGAGHYHAAPFCEKSGAQAAHRRPPGADQRPQRRQRNGAPQPDDQPV